MNNKLYRWVKASDRLPSDNFSDDTRVWVRRIDNNYRDCLSVSYLKIYPNLYEWLEEYTASTPTETSAGLEVLVGAIGKIQKELNKRSGFSVHPQVNNFLNEIIDQALSQYNTSRGKDDQDGIWEDVRADMILGNQTEYFKSKYHITKL